MISEPNSLSGVCFQGWLPALWELKEWSCAPAPQTYCYYLVLKKYFPLSSYLAICWSCSSAFCLIVSTEIFRTVLFRILFTFVEMKYFVLHYVDPNANGFYIANEIKYFIMGWFSVKLHMSCLTKGAAVLCCISSVGFGRVTLVCYWEVIFSAWVLAETQWFSWSVALLEACGDDSLQ